MKSELMLDKELNVQILMSRPSSNDMNVNEYFNIIITDGASRNRFISINIPIDQLANFFSTRITYATAKVTISSILGLYHENKTICVKMPGKQLPKEMSKIFEKAEKDNPGWTADREEYNHHHYTESGYNVILRRWVEDKEKTI